MWKYLLKVLLFLAPPLFARLSLPPNPDHVKKTVHLIFASHLDIGYHSDLGLPGTDIAVLSQYMTELLVKAGRIAEEFRQRGGPERYRYMTHSWLVSLFLDCPAHIGLSCPTQEDVEYFKQAVSRGDIVWHALPHNLQAEVLDTDLLAAAVQLTHELDQQLGVTVKHVMSQRDVPGLTRAAIPILHNQGVSALSVGVNSGSAPPAVPKNTPFIWKDEASGTSLLAFWHAGGYSGVPVDSKDECVEVDGFDHALCAAWRGDNAGPHSVEEILDIYSRVRVNFPDAEIIASTFDDFVKELEAAAPELDLPVITAEIGDTWVYGVASDPAKIAEYRALLRLRQASRDHWDDVAFKRFTRLLLKIPEHTWGLANNEYPGDYQNWNNTAFHIALQTNDRFQTAVFAWKRQRAYNMWAVDELGGSKLGLEAQRALQALHSLKTPPILDETLYETISMPITNEQDLYFSSKSWDIALDPVTGALAALVYKNAAASTFTSPEQSSSSFFGRKGNFDTDTTSVFPDKSIQSNATSWAAPDALLGKLVYSTYDEDSFQPIWTHYAWNPHNPWYGDFGKPNATAIGGARRRDAEAVLEKVWYRSDDDGGLHVVLKLAFDEDLVRDAGAPAAVYYDISSPATSDDLFMDVIWESKTPTRLPEALWLSFQPALSAVDSSSWQMSKLGSWISPLEVMRNGSMSMHAVDDGGVAVRSGEGGARLLIRSLDAALVSPGLPTPFPSVVDLPDLTQGMHYNLVNNIWGTNYVMWFPYDVAQDGNMRFRFVVQQEKTNPPQAVVSAV